MSEFILRIESENFIPHPPLEHFVKSRKKFTKYFVPDEPIMASDGRCIVLDVDGTLVDCVQECDVYLPKPVARPGLKEFFEFVFCEFECVIIWTAAKRVWYNKVYDECLKPNLPPGKNFHHVKTRDSSKPYVPLKPLSEIYAQFPQYNSMNTVVVDDNPATFRDNIENAVYVKPFFQDLLSKTPEERERLAALDKELYDIIPKIKRLLLSLILDYWSR